MESQLVLLTQKIAQTLRLVKRATKKTQKDNHIAQANRLCIQLQKMISQMPMNFNRNNIQQQLKVVKKTLETQSKKNVDNTDFSTSNANENKHQNKTIQLTPIQTSQKYVLTKLVEKQVRSSNLDIRQQQIQELAQGFRQNKEVMIAINELIHKQGQQLDLIETYNQKALDNIIEGNKQLKEADRLQVQGIKNKIRLGIGGILALIGTKLFGVAGGIAGFFTGIFSGSIFK